MRRAIAGAARKDAAARAGEALDSGAARAVFDDGAFLKGADSASPLLHRAVALNQAFASVVVACVPPIP